MWPWMRGDWTLVPEMLRIAQRTMRVVKGDIGFTAVYNVLGLTLAALGMLPPIFAAAANPCRIWVFWATRPVC